MAEKITNFVPAAGNCVPWKIIKEEVGEVPGNEELVKKQWEFLDAYIYAYIWSWVQR